MRTPDWDRHRCEDGALNLHAALEDALDDKQQAPTPLPFPEEASAYLTSVDAIHPIKSRQIAAVVLLEAERRGKAGKQ